MSLVISSELEEDVVGAFTMSLLISSKLEEDEEEEERAVSTLTVWHADRKNPSDRSKVCWDEILATSACLNCFLLRGTSFLNVSISYSSDFTAERELVKVAFWQYYLQK
jgi:hypothetical protein